MDIWIYIGTAVFTVIFYIAVSVTAKLPLAAVISKSTTSNPPREICWLHFDLKQQKI